MSESPIWVFETPSGRAEVAPVAFPSRPTEKLYIVAAFGRYHVFATRENPYSGVFRSHVEYHVKRMEVHYLKRMEAKRLEGATPLVEEEATA